MTTIKKDKIRPDWLGKTLAGALMGFALAVALSGIFAWVGPGGIDAKDKVQFNMWLIAPLWLSFFSFSYLFYSARRAIFWLMAANVLAWLLLWWVK
ncbi:MULTISPECIES: hypothetical protein [Shewanella]|uniref:Uncharacterized protein n=1 Tax=Shewanella chilikensis TaxID=558541 RepID=A0A6G7LSF8_9GAMM|nr:MULTISPECIES: hypothetical protein [Shewanella]MCE9782535.1 hypothetical protein [Shewanella algae]QIJ04709.1 hypothetical protein GII14_11475 [Shewanella chilikensis]